MSARIIVGAYPTSPRLIFQGPAEFDHWVPEEFIDICNDKEGREIKYSDMPNESAKFVFNIVTEHLLLEHFLETCEAYAESWDEELQEEVRRTFRCIEGVDIPDTDPKGIDGWAADFVTDKQNEQVDNLLGMRELGYRNMLHTSEPDDWHSTGIEFWSTGWNAEVLDSDRETAFVEVGNNRDWGRVKFAMSSEWFEPILAYSEVLAG